MLGEFDDVTVQMERERNNAGQMASKQRKFDQQLAEERKNYQALQADRDNMEKMARQNETKVLSMQNNLAEMEDRLAEVGLNCRFWNFLSWDCATGTIGYVCYHVCERV